MKKVCKKCKIFVEEAICPICKSTEFTETWKGRVVIFNPKESVIAKKLKITKEGIYAVKTH